MLYFCDTALHTSIVKTPKRTNKIEKNSDSEFIIMQSKVGTNKQEMKSKMKANKQDSDEKTMEFTETLKVLTALMMDQTTNA